MSLDRKTASRTLRDIATLLEVQGESVHRVRALANASRTIERIEGDLGSMVTSGEILDIKGIGKGTATILEQLRDGEKPDALVEAEKVVPSGVREMLRIPGLGPKKVRALWRDLDLSSVGELEYACRENRLVELPGFGAKTQEKLIDAIRYSRIAEKRRLIDEGWIHAREVAASLIDTDGVADAEIAGEVRRFCETAGSLELVVTAREKAEVAAVLCETSPWFEESSTGVLRGTTEGGFPITIRVVSAAGAAAALLWSTGSDEHLSALSTRAQARGLRLDERGLWRGEDRVDCPNEQVMYETLGCQWIPPELREGSNEVELAANGRLPSLVILEDLRGVLHNHTTDSDGVDSLEAMASAAGDRGWEFFGVADHSPVASYANGLSADRLRDQGERIDRLNATQKRLRVVKGLEADILPDGGLDIPEGCEEGLEYVVASVHSAFRLAMEDQTDRLVRAVSHRACRVLGHPTGRLLLARPGYAVDLERVLEACAEHGVAVEINASPYRLDLDWRWARRALELGIKLAVNPDAHSSAGLDDVRWGVAVARKAGATKDDLINCRDIEGFLSRTDV